MNTKNPAKKMGKIITMMAATIAIMVVGLNTACGSGTEVALATSVQATEIPRTTTAKPIQDLWLTTTTQVPSQVTVGETFPATILVQNQGAVVIETATLLAGLSSNLVLTDSQPKATVLEDGRLQWAISDLRPGEGRPLSLILKMQGQGPFRVNAYARGGVPVSGADSGSGIAIGEDLFTVHLSIEDSVDPVLVGGTVDYGIKVSAQGLAYSGGVLHVRFPTNLSLQKESPLPDSRDDNGLLFIIPTLEAGEDFRARITATGVSPGPGVTTVELSHADSSSITVQERTLVRN